MRILAGLLLLSCSLWPNLTLQADTEPTYEKRRAQLVQELIRWKITDQGILGVIGRVPRHRFVPPAQRPFAYENRPLPIGQQQTISQPYIVAFMTEALKLKSSDRVLEIGTGSGYQAAVLAELADTVYTIEIVAALGQQAKELLSELDYQNIKVRIGDGYQGWPEAAPFDAIMLTAAPREVPQPLLAQLAEGGRLVAPIGEHGQQLVLYWKEDGQLKSKPLLPVRFVPMTGQAQQSSPDEHQQQ